jgi:DNA-binding response OmpR family regulator
MRRSLAYIFERAGYHVHTAASAKVALSITQNHSPDLVLLDINMPGMNGLEALGHFRDRLHIPVIFVTARRRELDEVLGLDLGAEDYITKPFDPDILMARVRTVLRRATSTSAAASKGTLLIVGDLQIDPVRHTVAVGGTPVSLSAREFHILYTLALEAGGVVSAEELLAQVWGAEYAGESQAVYVYIRWLREKLEADPNNPCRIVNVRSVGYKLVPQEG